MTTTEQHPSDNIWAQVGTVTVTEAASLGVGDPCYGGLSSWPDVTVPAGVWCWDVRKLDGRTSEVRLRRDGVNVVDDWEWVDDYDFYVTNPQPDAVQVGVLGVDSGTMVWSIGRHDVDDDDLAYEPRDVPGEAGRMLITSTGWGDGGYPFAVRRDETGEMIEARVMFLTVDRARLDTAGVVGLLPGALAGIDGVEGLDRCTIRVSRRSYRLDADGDGEPGEVSYETVRGVLVDGVEYIDRYQDGPQVRYLPDVVGRVASVWSRAEPAAKAALTVAEEVVSVQPGVASGRVRDLAVSDVLITLRTVG